MHLPKPFASKLAKSLASQGREETGQCRRLSPSESEDDIASLGCESEPEAETGDTFGQTTTEDRPQKGLRAPRAPFLRHKSSERFGFNGSFRVPHIRGVGVGNYEEGSVDMFGSRTSLRATERFGFNGSYRPTKATAGQGPLESHSHDSADPDPATPRLQRTSTGTRYGFGAPQAVKAIPDGHVFHRRSDYCICVEGVL